MIDPVIQRVLENMRAGRLDVALALVQDILKRRPDDHNAAQILALLLVQSGKLEAALPYLAAAVAAEPRANQYRNNYANTLLQLKRYADAVEQWERAVEVDPQYAFGWLGLACARIYVHDSAGARQAAERGLALRPGWPEITRALVVALEWGGDLEEALAVCERALAADPRDPALRSTYLLLLNYQSEGGSLIPEAHREFGRLHGRPPNPPHLAAKHDRFLRVGVLSADLRTHSVAFFAEPFLRHVPPWAEVTVFSLAATPEDVLTRRLRDLVSQWIEVGAMDNLALNNTIRAHQIDVLIELHGHTGGNRLPALADQPAPVIISALGYPNTTGLPSVDWRLVDSTTDPPGTEDLSTERLLRLDPCFLCYSPPPDAPDPVLPPRSAPITFGSFNALSKISDLTLQIWAQVIATVPASRLLLKANSLSDPSAKSRLIERLANAGISPARAQIVPHTPTIREHLEIYSRVHLALDTTPYNGTTTTCEALWMGVPVVCLAGNRHAARVSASLLAAIGRPDLVAQSTAEYVAIAVQLANDRPALHQLRLGLRESMRQSPLVDDVNYAARFYTAVRSCWVDWCVMNAGPA